LKYFKGLLRSNVALHAALQHLFYGGNIIVVRGYAQAIEVNF
jgi:hypothetical protein